jgi:hypothetical protein
VNYAMLFAARVGTAVGEAGGSPPSHSLISDAFRRAGGAPHSIYALCADRHVARRRARRLGQPAPRLAHDVCARRRAGIGLPSSSG